MQTNWRIGSTSYVYPGDLMNNLRCLAGEVDDVELILFDDDKGVSNLPSPAEVREMCSVLGDAGMSATVHLPRDVGGNLPEAEVQGALDLNRRVIELTQALNPVAFVFHVHTVGNGSEAWRERALACIGALAALVEDPRQLALENLESYAPEALDGLFASQRISRALDIGHLWKQRRDPLPVMAQWLPWTSVVHLHGVCEVEGRMVDHLSLACMEHGEAKNQLDSALRALEGWQGVLTLEVFEDDYFSSRAVLNRAVLNREVLNRPVLNRALLDCDLRGIGSEVRDAA